MSLKRELNTTSLEWLYNMSCATFWIVAKFYRVSQQVWNRWNVMFWSLEKFANEAN